MHLTARRACAPLGARVLSPHGGSTAGDAGRWTSVGAMVSAGLDFPVIAGDPTADEVLRRGFTSFLSLAEYVRRTPYGRPADAQDILAVLKEHVGTCSSKHRLLATVAHACNRKDVELVVGIYEMCEENTPGVGVVLERAGLASIPEAHCYLQAGGQRYDFTGVSSGSASPFASLRSEQVVSPQELPGEKLRLHRQAVEAWCAERRMSFPNVWAVREACIEALAFKHSL